MPFCRPLLALSHDPFDCCPAWQIYDLESNYFQVSSSMGNAIRGYEGFLGGSKKVGAGAAPGFLACWLPFG